MCEIRTFRYFWPYQRAALLVARWSGARRGEICRLAVDCLDVYPDGTARLRIPAGKTLKERVVPLHEEAAEARHFAYAKKRVYDPIIEALSGFADIQSDAKTRRPQMIRTIVADKTTAIFAAQAITAALYRRRRYCGSAT